MDKQSTKKDEHDKDDEEEDNNDSKLLKEEVNAALKELPFAVEHIAVSEKLPHNDDIVYLNITTCEKATYCVELTINGWRLVSKRHDHLIGVSSDKDGDNAADKVVTSEGSGSDLKTEEDGNERIDKLINGRHFETIYQLLDCISPIYRQKFADQLIFHLNKLQEKNHSESPHS